MGENTIAETCLCNAGIASGNMLMQKNILDQFYRTTVGGFGKRESSTESEGACADDEEEEEEEFKETKTAWR